jgi:hypothetical protein
MLWQISTRRNESEDYGETTGNLISVWSVGSNLVLCDIAEWDRSANTSCRCESQPPHARHTLLTVIGKITRRV